MHTWPQIILALYLALNQSMKLYEYGKEKRVTGMYVPFITAMIAYWGGFWY